MRCRRLICRGVSHPLGLMPLDFPKSLVWETKEKRSALSALVQRLWMHKIAQLKAPGHPVIMH